MSALHNADCFTILPTLPKKSIQLVVVDLPYGQTACAWDERLDLEKMWKELRRILKPNGKCVFFTTAKFGNELINSNPKWFRYDLVWEKTNSVGFLLANKQPLRTHELIYVFHNYYCPQGFEWIYNPQMTEGKPYMKANPAKESDVYGRQTLVHHANEGTRFPTSVIKIKKDNRNKKLHSTAKPVELCEWLIKSLSNEGDMVLDFTMGSGSTIIACIHTNRNYTGIEKNADIFKVADERIKEAIKLKN
jgi:site-specific DNA-methyltransferase (adenine-specific)